MNVDCHTSDRKKSSKSRGKQCCVYGCNNFQYTTTNQSTGIHFFSIPSAVLKDNNLKKRWCSLIKRQDGKDGFSFNSNTVICQNHFNVEEQIDISLVAKKWSLRKGVEPCLFDWRKLPSERRAVLRHVRQPLKEKVDNFISNSSTYSKEFELQAHGNDSIADNLLFNNNNVNDNKICTFIQLGRVRTALDHQTVYKATQWDEEDVRKTMSSASSESINSSNVNVEIKQLRDKIDKLTSEIENLKFQLNEYDQNKFSLDKIQDDNKAMLFYTGFANYGIFESVFEYLQSKGEKLQYWRGKSEVSDFKPYQNQGTKPGQKRKLSLKEEFFIVLLRLKVGLFVRDISERFNISQGQFSKLFTTWINFLYHELPLIFPFPSKELISKNLPKSFALYPSTRIILDCTEVFIEIPSSMTAQSETWSNYKHHNTYKVLVGVSPNGVCTFVSDLWGGRVSDKEITKQSGILELLEPGDNIMADKGFLIDDILPPGVTLNIPPFKGPNQQLSSKDVEATMNIAAVRIHVEREMARIKNYHILDGILPLSLKHISNQMFSVIAYLTNFMPPLVPPGNSNREVLPD